MAKKYYSKFLGITIGSAKYNNGHQWLAHGLLERYREVKKYNSEDKLILTTIETEWYPLYNWGWDGKCDGYYLSGVFDAKNGKKFEYWEDSSRSSDDDYEDYDENYAENEQWNFKYKPSMIIGIRK